MFLFSRRPGEITPLVEKVDAGKNGKSPTYGSIQQFAGKYPVVGKLVLLALANY